MLAPQQSKELSDAIKEKVKDLGFVRYKIIVQVRRACGYIA